MPTLFRSFDRCLQLFCDVYSVDPSDVSAETKSFLSNYKISSFLGDGGRALVMECGGGDGEEGCDDPLAACLVGTRDVKAAVARLKEAWQEGKRATPQGRTPITIPRYRE